MFLRLLALILIWALVGVSPATARSCYDRDGFQAEQFIRYHTQLMVIGMTCQTHTQGQSYTDYQRFMHQHQNLVRTQDEALGLSNAERQTLKTQIANNMSRVAMMYAPQQFCHLYMPYLTQANGLSARALGTRMRQSLDPNRPSSRPLCTQ